MCFLHSLNQHNARKESGLTLPLWYDSVSETNLLEQESAEVSFKGIEPAWRGERSSPVARAFLSSIRDSGAKPGFVVKTGTSDMNVVGPAWSCPILAYGPGDSSLDHTPVERISLIEYHKAITILQSALSRLAGLL